MRRSSRNCSFIIENGVFYGVSLGWDFCAEHEWGIGRMRTKFGITKDKIGPENRQITTGKVFLKEIGKTCILTSREPYGNKANSEKLDDYLPHDLRYLYDELETAWNEEDFCVVSQNPETFHYLKELAEAFEKKNVLITFLKSNLPAFENASLSLLILDKLPPEIIQEMVNVDKKAKDLVEYEKEIGVTALKEKARESGYKREKYFMACSAKWICYEDSKERERLKKQLKTKYDVQFWINYSDDDDNYGWYIAEDIIKWLSTPGLKLTAIKKKEHA